jgi:hypothetical protein
LGFDDADVSSNLAIRPYGGFSPIGWKAGIGQHLPTHSRAPGGFWLPAQLLHLCQGRLAPCDHAHPHYASVPEQGLCFLQIARVEPFSEPAVDRCEQLDVAT